MIPVFLFGLLPETKSQSGVPAPVSAKIFNNKRTDTTGIMWVDTIPNGNELKGLVIRGICKEYKIVYPLFPIIQMPVEILPNEKVSVSNQAKKRVPLLKVSGNIMYDVNYRSRIDTPYAENNVYQHTLQTRLDLVYKGRYPFRIYLTTRFGNSSLLRKYTDMNFQYSQADFIRLIKKTVTEAVESFISSKTGELDSLRRQIELKMSAISSLNQAIQKPDISQKLVEEREKNLLQSGTVKVIEDTTWDISGMQNELTWPGKYKFAGSSQNKTMDGIESNQADNGLQKFDSCKDNVENKKRKLDSLVTELGQIGKLYGKVKAVQQFNLNEWRKEIEGVKDANSLTQKLRQLNIPDTLLPKGYKTLYAIQSFSIGRSVANYSELSVKDISITGLQVEYNPHYYYAFAAGKVDYRFRDYLLPDRSRSNQYVVLARFGKGMKNGNHVIFTYYTGRRQFFNSSIASQPNNPVPEYNLAGITIEGFYKINRNTSLIAEVAKSTVPYYSLDSVQRKNWMNSVTRFKDRSNEAYSVKVNSYLPGTQTRFTANLSYLGANFQSFSTFTTGASRMKWLARIEQPFFGKKLNIISSVQQNDYNNPFATTTYKSSSILASFQVNLRIKKWPVVSIGYYPSYQLTKINDNNYSENRYYTLVANTGYYYHIHLAQLSTYIVFSQFYNKSSDSGFVYFNSKNLLISQNIAINRFSVLLNVSISSNTGYNIYTIENNDQFAINKFITAGGGLKMIKHSFFNQLQWGYSGNLLLKIPKLGDIQMMMDKGFIPGNNRQLVENRMGRLTYYKTF